ncbi:hypothetical protein [Streptomyces sp. NPDC096152]|uniref:hypothetical protein n=1 Tax=Streptomyces sp. NPDC096152 TaxID=3366078 RepID=UPI0037FD1F63
MVMARHWYSSSPVVDGLPLLDEPGFWPAHLADLSEGHPPEAFGSDAGDAAAMLDQLHDPSAWPMFTVPLVGGFTIVLHYNSGEEFTSTDYFLTHPDWSQDLVLASDDQDRIGPGLCWPELTALLEAPPGAGGVTDPHTRLLLLLPVLGDAAVPEEAVTGWSRLWPLRVRPKRARRWPDACSRDTPCGAPGTGGSTMTNRAGSARAITAPAKFPSATTCPHNSEPLSKPVSPPAERLKPR